MLSVNSAAAAVVENGTGGFVSEHRLIITAPPDAVYDALLHPAKWWNAAHSYSHDAANFAMDGKAGGCFCETWRGGSAEHARVVLAIQGSSFLCIRGLIASERSR